MSSNSVNKDPCAVADFGKPMEPGFLNQKRVVFLDGIRGWASFFVLLSHILAGFLVLSMPGLDFGKVRWLADLNEKNYLSFLAGILFRFVTDGHLAVIVFFVLSGYALSVNNFQPEKRDLARAFLARYFRLAIPILITSAIAYLLLKFGFLFNLKAALVSGKYAGWLGSFYDFDPSIKSMMTFALYDVFFRYDASATYNSSLWTMPIEILGSFFIYTYLAIFRSSEKVYWRLVLLTTLALVVYKPLYACFAVGLLVAEINKKYPREKLFSSARYSEFGLVLIVCVVSALSTFYQQSDRIALLVASLIVFSFVLAQFAATIDKQSFSIYGGNIICSLSCADSNYLLLVFIPFYKSSIARPQLD